MSLERCVDEPRRFLDAVFGRDRYLRRGTSDTYAALMTTADLDALVAVTNPRFLRLVNAGEERAVGDTRVPEIRAALAAGGTLRVGSLQELHPPVGAFARDLGSDLGRTLHVEALVTPAGSRGVALDHDLRDVFVLQLAGSQQWELHRSDSPIRDAAAEIVTLRAGDTLYLPRGVPHAPQARYELSIHLVVHPVLTRAALLVEAVRALDDLWLRESVDPTTLGRDPRSLARLGRLLAGAVARGLPQVDLAAVIDRVHEESYVNAPEAPVGIAAGRAFPEPSRRPTREVA